MDLTPYVDDFRHELAVAADAGGEEARALARRLTAPLEAAARLTLLNALSAAMGEVTRELAPGCSVTVQLRGLEPEFVVTRASGAVAPEEADEQLGAAQGTRASVAPVVPLFDAGLPGGCIRIRFATARGLEAATALFDGATPDHETLVLHLPSDGGVPALRAVLDALDDAGIEAAALTAHTTDLDDIFHALVGPPWPEEAPGAPSSPRPPGPRKSPEGDAG